MVYIPFDMLEKAKETEGIVCSDNQRKYFRFRYQSQWWSPCVADASGCCLSCAYCWNVNRNKTLPGTFRSPEYVAKKLNSMPDKHREDWNRRYMRTGGCEPVLGEKSLSHLIEVLKLLECEKFLLETNGMMLGHDLSFFDRLEPFKDILLVRITAKAHNPERFEKITGVYQKYFWNPIKAIHEAGARGFDCELAYMPDFCDGAELRKISKWRGEYDTERLSLYPPTVRSLKERDVMKMRYKV